jgi:hypothetical protein
LKKFAVGIATFAILIVLGSALIAPPHYFVIHVGQDVTSAAIRVGGVPARSAYALWGFVLAKTDAAESSAIIDVTTAKGVHHCRFGYFTHSEFEPHYLPISDCGAGWN